MGTTNLGGSGQRAAVSGQRPRWRRFSELRLNCDFVTVFCLFLTSFVSCILSSCIYVMGHETPVTIEALEAILEKKFGPIRDSIHELTNAVSFLSNKFDSIDKRVSEMEHNLKEVDKENSFLKAEVFRLSKAFLDVTEEINNIEQYSRRECCEIAGIPVQPGEDTNDLVIKVGSLMGVDLEKCDISVSHRLPTPNYSSRLGQEDPTSGRERFPALQFPKVIVKFVRREKKELFYRNRKNLKDKSTNDLGLSRISENGIFVSESLSQRNRNLFKECLNFKRMHGFKFIWTQQGRTYLRKDINTPARLITCKADLEKLSR